MGILFVLIMERAKLPAEMRPLLMTGFLGAFTTFSTFSLETVTLIHEGHVTAAIFYVLLSVVLSVTALAVAIWLTRLI
jgi:CrcB protein